MKKLTRNALIFGLLIGTMSLAACGGGQGGEGDKSTGKGPWTVKFDTNGGAETYPDQIVENKGLVTDPGTPTKVDPVKGTYTFTGWNYDGAAWSFKNSKVTKDMTLVAGWLAKYSVSYKDASGAAIGEVSYVDSGSALTAPSAPAAPSGQVFYGWKNNNNGGQIWNYEDETLNKVMADVEFQPLFVPAGMEPQVFEAEECPDFLDDKWGPKGMPGATYSGGQNGLGLVGQDFYDESGKNKYGTSGRYEVGTSVVAGFAHFLYAKGDTLTWELESDAAASNVTIFMRLSAEYGILNVESGEYSSWVDDETFPVMVNGEAIKYGKVTLHNITPMLFIPFQDYFLSASVNLVAGKNTIQMKVDNTVSVNGTIASSAPVVDCIKLYSTSHITWPDACPDNLNG